MSLMIDVYLRGAPVAPPEMRPTLKLLYPEKGWKGWKWQVAAVLAVLLIPRVPQVLSSPIPPLPQADAAASVLAHTTKAVR